MKWKMRKIYQSSFLTVEVKKKVGSCINNSDAQMWTILLHLDVFVAIHGNISTTYFFFYSAFHKHMQCLGLLVLPALDGYLIHWIFVRVQLKTPWRHVCCIWHERSRRMRMS